MIYIDLGCNNGDTIKEFYEGKFYEPEGTILALIESIGIDPLTKYKKEWAEISSMYRTKFINEAAMDFNGKIQFSEKEQDIKSSVVKSKINWNKGKIYNVPCFDFADYVKREGFNDMIIRMDIEGAEFYVLSKMIENGTIEKIKYLEIEWHQDKLEDHLYQFIKKEIVAKLDELKINWRGFR